MEDDKRVMKKVPPLKCSTEDEQEQDIKLTMGGLMPQIFGEKTDLHGLLYNIIKVAAEEKSEEISVDKETGAVVVVIAKEQGSEAQPTNQTEQVLNLTTTTIPAPVNIAVARSLKDISPHHASCINSILNAMIGLGFVSEGDDVEKKKKDSATSTAGAEDQIISLLTGESFVESKVDKSLDKLTIDGFYLELSRGVEDFLDGGTGYLEIIRNEEKIIVGINWIPYEDLTVSTVKDADGKSRIVYLYKSSTNSVVNTTRRYSMFGLNNRDWVFDTFYAGNSGVKKEQVSEVIAFKCPSNRSKWYGYPGWLSAASLVTLLGLAMQYKSDFYTNRGVLAYILSILGQVPADKWKQIEAMVQSSVGGGNNFRNLAINLPAGDNNKVEVHKLASTDKTELQFAKDLEVYAQNIVSAHRVPPVLANILIPGKLGATNEAVQALVSFQLLNVGPKQNIIQQTLSRTLGGTEGVEGLEPEDFRLRKITSQFNIAGLDTVGKMREEAVSATNPDGSQRDVSAGVKD
jgi:hypothetical protein